MPGQPANFPLPYPPCARNGVVSKRKKQRVAIRDYESGEGQRYSETDKAAAPSEANQSKATAFLLRFASVSTRPDWIEQIYQAIVPLTAWAEQKDAFASDTLLNLAQRCLRAETVSVGMRFVKIMYELLFAAKVNR